MGDGGSCQHGRPLGRVGLFVCREQVGCTGQEPSSAAGEACAQLAGRAGVTESASVDAGR